MKQRGAIAGLAMVALMAAWAAVGTRGGRDVRAQEPGVIGQPSQIWDEALGLGNDEGDGFLSYPSGDGGTFYVGIDANDATTFVEWVVPSGGVLDFGDAEEFVVGLLPGDAELVEVYDEISVSTGDRGTVQLYRSDSITGAFVDATGASGFLLVAYGRDGTGPDVTRVSIGVGCGC